jgi:hypothetical protein
MAEDRERRGVEADDGGADRLPLHRRADLGGYGLAVSRRGGLGDDGRLGDGRGLGDDGGLADDGGWSHDAAVWRGRHQRLFVAAGEHERQCREQVACVTSVGELHRAIDRSRFRSNGDEVFSEGCRLDADPDSAGYDTSVASRAAGRL